MNDIDSEGPHEAVRFTDILTTASAIADYCGDGMVAPRHVVGAIDVLVGVRTMTDFGRPVSPLVRRTGGGVEESVRSLAQRWFDGVGRDVTATLTRGQLADLRREVQALE